MPHKFVSFRHFEVLICMNLKTADITTYVDRPMNIHHFIFRSHGVAHEIAMSHELLSRRKSISWTSLTAERAIEELRAMGPFRVYNSWNYQIKTARGFVFP